MNIEKLALSLGVELPENLTKRLQEKENWLRLADAPFPYRHYKVNYDGSIYISQQCIADRNALLFDQYRYDAEEAQVNTDRWSVGVWVRMHAVINGVEHSIRQYGVNMVNKLRTEVKPSGDTVEQAIKSAVSDGMKKCSSWLGIAAHIYRGEVISIKPNRDQEGRVQSKFYMQTLEKFGLSEYNYRYGIPVLPDAFKPYYEKMGWTDGIFYSDVYYFKNKQAGEREADAPSQEKVPKQPENAVEAGGQEEKPSFISEKQAGFLRGLIHDFNKEAQEEDIVQVIAAYLHKKRIDVVKEVESLGSKFDGVHMLPAEHFPAIQYYFKQLKKSRLANAEEKTA
jgi:hypothetical protein